MKYNRPAGIGVLTSVALLTACAVDVHAYCVFDSSFNPAGSFSGGATISAVVVQTDGKVVFGGSFVYSGNYPSGYPFTVTNLVRFNLNGTVDTGYNPAPNGVINAMAIQPDNKIIIAGTFSQVSGMAQMLISRLTTSGYPDYIGFQAPAPNGYILALALQSDGKVVVGGNFSTMNGSSYSRLARLNSTGTLDKNFNPGVYGPPSSPIVYSLAVHAPGTPSADKIVVGGDFSVLGSLARQKLGRLNANGTVDSSFDMGSSAILNAPVYAIATDYGPFGINGQGGNFEKVLIGGSFTALGGIRNYFARLSDNGTPDANVSNSYVDGVVKAIRVQADHKMVLGGSFTHAQSYTRNGLTRLTANGDLVGLDLDWSDCTPNGATGGSVETLAINAAGVIYAGGSFTSVEGNARPKVTRLWGAP